jgi:hypothetical protein
MKELSNNLNEPFDSNGGVTDGLVTFSGTAVNSIYDSNYHNNLRSFNYDPLTIGRTVVDLKRLNVGAFQGAPMSTVQTVTLSGTTGTENWLLTTSGVGGTTLTPNISSITVPNGKITGQIWQNPDKNYANTMRVNFSGTSILSGTVHSFGRDDIYTDLSNDGDYRIAVDVLDFPTVTASGYFNLTQSYVDISSDPTDRFSVSRTDSLPFSDSLTSVTGLGFEQDAVVSSSYEISDAIRTAALYGDGLSPESSYGIWSSSTNLVPNGGAETNTTGMINEDNTTIGTGTNEGKFGSKSFEVTATVAVPGRSPIIGVTDLAGSRIAVTASLPYTFSLWMRMREDYGVKLGKLRWIAYDGGGSQVGGGDVESSTLTLTTSYQKISLTATPPVTTTSLRLLAYCDTSASVSGEIYDIDGVQLEQSSFVTPYIETNGATATRPVANILVPSLFPGNISILNSERGSAVFRVRTGFANTTAGTFPLFIWGNQSDIQLASYIQGGLLYLNREIGSIKTTSLGTFSAGTKFTLGVKWANNTLYTSINGSNWSSGTSISASPARILAPFITIGYFATNDGFSGDFFWSLLSENELSNSDLATLYALGDTDPTWNTLPPSAGVTAVLPFSTDAFERKASKVAATLTFPRTSLTKSTLDDIRGVRFRLTTSGIGEVEFTPYNMRVYPTATFSRNDIEVDSRRKAMVGALTASGVVESADTGPLYFYPAQPKNLKQVVRFNTGTIPITASGTNQFDLYYRSSASGTNNINLSLKSNSTSSAIVMVETISGTVQSTFATSGTLLPNTRYVLRTELTNKAIRSTVRPYRGVFYGPITLDTGWRDLRQNAYRGYTGFRFLPYHFNFLIEDISAEEAEFGEYITKPLSSFKTVDAVQLNANYSQPIALLDTDDFEASGDAYSVVSPTGMPAPDYLVTRSGTDYYGGFISSEPIYLRDTQNLYVTGNIYPYTGEGSTTYLGNYRVVIVDTENTVAYLQDIPDLVSDKWNYFSLPVRSDILPSKYYVVIENYGSVEAQFEIDNVKINHETIAWYASNGVSWQPFLDAVNRQYSALHFTEPGDQITVKAAALSDTDSWIEGYTLIPLYN